jgi:Ser/Thr protein kinase RdoA (MazF antagonist)
VDVKALQEYVDVRLRRLADRDVMSRDTRDRINEHLARLGAAIPPADLRDVAIHADLAPANILLSGSRIVLLDFAMAGRGTGLHDISRLYMQLELMGAKPQFRRRVIQRLTAGLLAGYDSTLRPDRPLFRLLSMLHHVNHFGTLALRREGVLGRLVSGRVMAMHRRWIATELSAGAGAR